MRWYDTIMTRRLLLLVLVMLALLGALLVLALWMRRRATRTQAASATATRMLPPAPPSRRGSVIATGAPYSAETEAAPPSRRGSVIATGVPSETVAPLRSASPPPHLSPAVMLYGTPGPSDAVAARGSLNALRASRAQQLAPGADPWDLLYASPTALPQ